MAVSKSAQSSSVDQSGVSPNPVDPEETTIADADSKLSEHANFAANGDGQAANSAERYNAQSDSFEDEDYDLGDFPYANGFYGELPLAEVTSNEPLPLAAEELADA